MYRFLWVLIVNKDLYLELKNVILLQFTNLLVKKQYVGNLVFFDSVFDILRFQFVKLIRVSLGGSRNRVFTIVLDYFSYNMGDK